jgi:hypothetical protein
MHAIRMTILLVALTVPAAVNAQRFDRESTWEIGLGLVDTQSESLSADFGTGLDIRGELGVNVWGTFNFNNRLALTVDWTHVSPKYTATFRVDGGNLETLSYEADFDHLHFKGTYNFLEGDMTPFVEVGIGWSWLDSNVSAGPPSTGCWWDPWWGYICAPFFNTYSTRATSFSYAVGYRWDLSPDYTVRLDYGVVDIDMSEFSGSAEIKTLKAGFAWRF